MNMSYEQTLGDGEGQGSLAGCSSWGGKESDTTERLKNNSGDRYWAPPWVTKLSQGGQLVSESLPLC